MWHNKGALWTNYHTGSVWTTNAKQNLLRVTLSDVLNIFLKGYVWLIILVEGKINAIDYPSGGKNKCNFTFLN